MNKNNITTDYLIETESIMEKLYKTKNYFDCKLNYNTQTFAKSTHLNFFVNIIQNYTKENYCCFVFYNVYYM